MLDFERMSLVLSTAASALLLSAYICCSWARANDISGGIVEHSLCVKRDHFLETDLTKCLLPVSTACCCCIISRNLFHHCILDLYLLLSMRAQKWARNRGLSAFAKAKSWLGEWACTSALLLPLPCYEGKDLALRSTCPIGCGWDWPPPLHRYRKEIADWSS